MTDKETKIPAHKEAQNVREGGSYIDGKKEQQKPAETAVKPAREKGHGTDKA